jgi:hypothetical protein
MNRRTDRTTAGLIDAIVGGHTLRGGATAARKLAAAGVPLHVTLRILTRPDERRRRDLAQPTATSL